MKKQIGILALLVIIIPAIALASRWGRVSLLSFKDMSVKRQIQDTTESLPVGATGLTAVALNAGGVSLPKTDQALPTQIPTQELVSEKPTVTSEPITISKEEKLAQCLAKNGAKFYGAFWCPHCQKQKKLFGQAVKELPYIECSTPNGKAQTSVCADAGITSYPTWKFPDGTTHTGEMALSELSTKTNCPLD